MGTKIHAAAVASFGWYAAVFPFLGRVLQGSAETTGESLVYEVAVTLAELTLADSFLKSRTPIESAVYMLRSVFVKNSDEVAPDKSKRITRGSLEGVESWQRSFCETGI